MSKIVKISDIADKALAPYTSLTEAQLRNRLNPADAIFIAESPKVIRVAMAAGYRPVSMLMEERHIAGDAADIIESLDPDTPVFTAPRDILASLTGYTLTRGVLAAMRRPSERPVSEIVNGASRIVVLDSVVDTTNIGAIFRSAAALGVDAVLLTRQSCDPLNRRAVRVSMGTVFQVPWTWIDDPVTELRQLGFTTAAMALRDDALRLGRETDFLTALPRLAIIMGTEGDGLSNRVIAGADHVVMIDMARNVDSLNVAAASAVAIWQLSPR